MSSKRQEPKYKINRRLAVNFALNLEHFPLAMGLAQSWRRAGLSPTTRLR